ncbi:tyrosine-protein kinase family protein, partial [Micrococcus luteus]
MRIALATTVQPGLDHIGPLERHQTDITVLRRAEDLAELLAIARSGLVDAVLVAGGTESLTTAFLEETARLPRPVGVAALSEVRAERRRLRGMGVPCVRADADPEQIAAVVVESASAAAEGRRPETSHGEDADHARDHGEDLDDLPITLETLGGDEVPGLTDPWRDADEPDDAGPGAAPAAATSDDGPATADEGADPAPSPEGDEPAEPARESSLVTVVWGPTGAPGRTTVAVNLAAEHAVAGRNTLLVDLDTYGPAVGVHLGLTEESAGVARAVRRADHGRLGAADL